MPEQDNPVPVSTEAPPEELKPPLDQAKFVWPSLEKGPAVCYDTELRQVWIGIPFDKVNNPLKLLAFIDRCKLDVLGHLDQYALWRMRMEQLKAGPIGARIKKTMSDIFQKGKSLISQA